MHSDVTTVLEYLEYLDSLPDERREAVETVRDVVNEHLPDGYVEQMDWGMISWVVPFEDYPHTYDKKPLRFASLASQKHHLAICLMGLYAGGPEENWFRKQYAERGLKLDMGRSCVRFERLEEVPLDVLGEAIAKVPVGAFITQYEDSRRSVIG